MATNDESGFVLKKTEGFIHKKGGAVNKGIGGRRNWLKRWFVLEKKQIRGRDNYTLHYFESQKGKQKGSVDLEGTEVFCERKPQHTNKNVRYEFQIQLQNGSLLQLSCDDFQDRDDWIESLNYAITSMRKPVTERPTFMKVSLSVSLPLTLCLSARWTWLAMILTLITKKTIMNLVLK
jgi:hypothetical protein